jgi:ubiquinone/menaquinone biosynthesis C-methylase UbiE
MMIETEVGREKRRRQRVLFDSVAELYDASRPVYTDDAVDCLVRTAGLDSASAVLEVGCGTGQLTGQLAARGFKLTAIDIGPSMIAAARRRVRSDSVTLLATSFEDLAAEDGSFSAIVSADAFHWIDPELRFSKSARLLSPGGWLAVLSLHYSYDEPLKTALQKMWVARSDDGGNWLSRPGPTIAEIIGESGYFGTAVETSYSTRLSVPASSVVDVENTRATSLSWPDNERRVFSKELRGHIPAESVGLTQVATVTMAQVARRH